MSSRSSSPSTSRSSSPFLEEVAAKLQSATSAHKPGPRNEGTDPDWAYAPPNGFQWVRELAEGNEAFDWDALNDDDDTELWVIRVPDKIKPKHLQSLSLPTPSSSSAAKTRRLATLPIKDVTYDLWNVGDIKMATNPEEREGIAASCGGHEMKSLAALLPRKSKAGKLYLAPKPITRHLVLSAQSAETQSSQAGAAEHPHDIRQNKPRPAYSDEVLKHRYTPPGRSSIHRHSASAAKAANLAVAKTLPPPSQEVEMVEASPTKTKGQKRKKGGDESASPKKAKKSKVQ